MRFVYFLFLFAAPFLTVAAESVFWVSVGSFKTESRASDTADIYRGRYSDDFSVVGSYTDRGFFYRVALGPYSSKEEAQSNLESLKIQGLASAWIWVERGDSIPIRNDGAEDISEELYRELENYKAKYDLDLDLDTPFDDLSGKELDRGRSDVDDMKLAEPPEGYQLNKLRRGAINFVPKAVDQVAQAFLEQGKYEEEAYDISNKTSVLNLEEGKPIRLVRRESADSEVNIDGSLDEVAWRELSGVEQFVAVSYTHLTLPTSDLV